MQNVSWGQIMPPAWNYKPAWGLTAAEAKQRATYLSEAMKRNAALDRQLAVENPVGQSSALLDALLSRT